MIDIEKVPLREYVDAPGRFAGRTSTLTEGMRIRQQPIPILILLACLAVLLAGFSQQAHPASAKTPAIWLGPSDPASGKIPLENYMALFTRNSAWGTTRSKTRVFKIYADIVWELPDRELQIIFNGLRRHHIALALEAGVLTAQKSCGHHVEGYVAPSRPSWSVQTALRIKALGGDLHYLAMDEPLYFGHYYHGRSACRSSIGDIARNAAMNVRGFKSVFPQMKTGDIEPISGTPPDDWEHSARVWINAFRSAYGEPLAFWQADVRWGTIRHSAPNNLTRLQKLLISRQIPLGVIINAGSQASSDRSWTRMAWRNLRLVHRLGISPSQWVFQSWSAWPKRLVPDSSRDTMTGLVKRYIIGQKPLR